MNYLNIYNFGVLRLLKNKFIRGHRKHLQTKIGKALVYFKTDSFIPGFINQYLHTNYWEIQEIARILNLFGYEVDVIDRSANISQLNIEDEYDILLAAASSDSTKDFPLLAQMAPSATTIFYATTANPVVHNRHIEERYEYLKQRVGVRLPARRLATKVNMDEAMKYTQYIFSVGGNFANNSYARYRKPIFPISLSTAPWLHWHPSAAKSRQGNNFIFFAGSGNIGKGLDLAIEAFTHVADANLHICTNIEPEFWSIYGNTIAAHTNIHVHGIIPVRGTKFRHLSEICTFALLPSCTEGRATSILTCMRQGMVPVVTNQVGIDNCDDVIYIDEETVEGVISSIRKAMSFSPTELSQKMLGAYLYSLDYTQAEFTKSFTRALGRVLIQERAYYE